MTNETQTKYEQIRDVISKYISPTVIARTSKIKTLIEDKLGITAIKERRRILQERKAHPKTMDDILLGLEEVTPNSPDVLNYIKNENNVLVGFHYSLPGCTNNFTIDFHNKYFGKGDLKVSLEIDKPWFVPSTAIPDGDDNELCRHCGITSRTVYYAIPKEKLQLVPKSELVELASLSGTIKLERYHHVRSEGGPRAHIKIGTWYLDVRTTVNYGNEEITK